MEDSRRRANIARQIHPMYRQIARNKRWSILLVAFVLGSHPSLAERVERLNEIGRGF